jgi:flagellar biosynthesis/type III secretory pathway chaperone
MGLQRGSTCAELLPVLPEPYQPLVSALVDENNDLLVRVQQRARQNHLLMARSIQLMQEFLGALVSDRTGPTYGHHGAVRNSPGAPCGLREMVA